MATWKPSSSLEDLQGPFFQAHREEEEKRFFPIRHLESGESTSRGFQVAYREKAPLFFISMSLKYEPFSEPLHIFVRQLQINFI